MKPEKRQQISRDWTDTTFGDVAEYITSGSRDWSKYYSDHGAMFIRTQDINTNRLRLDDVAHVALPEKVEGKRTRVFKDDILITITGANVGKVALVDHDIGEAYVSQSVALVRLKDRHLGKFLHYQLMTKFRGDKTHLEAMAYGLGRPVLNLDNIRNTPIRLVSLDHQKRIVAEIEKQFSRLDEAVANLKRVKANLKRYKATVLKAAVEGKLTEAWRKAHPDVEPASELLKRILAERRAKWNGKGKYKEPIRPDTVKLPPLEDGWVYASVEQLGIVGEQAVLTGPFGTNLGRKDFTETGVPVLTISCLQETGINLEKADFVSEEKAQELERYRLKSGDLLFSRMASVGRAGIVGERLRHALFNYHIMRLRLEPTVLLAKYYMAYVRGSVQVDRYIRDVNHGATRDGINTEQLLNMPVALPPLAEQARIVAEVERRLSVVEELEAMVSVNFQRANRLRQSILKRAFEARLTNGGL